jgi:hypothetical protein
LISKVSGSALGRGEPPPSAAPTAAAALLMNDRFDIRHFPLLL